MRYLIDGYNLLHAMGVLHGQTGPKVLEKARLRLLSMLRGRFEQRTGNVTVVFDAAHAPPGEALLEAQALHHRQHRRARKAARRAEVLDRFGDRGTAPIGNVPEKRQFLFAYRCLSHGWHCLDYTCRQPI